MSALSKKVKLSFKKTPRGFVKRLARELEDQLEADSPKDTGKLESSNRVSSMGNGEFRLSNRTHYASYVDKSGPRVGGKGKKRWFSDLANSRGFNSFARSVRNKMLKEQKKKGK